MQRAVRTLVLALMSAALIGSCGDDDSDTPSNASAAGGSKGSADKGGAGDAGDKATTGTSGRGAPNSGGDTTTNTGAQSAPVKCGSTMCMPPAFPGGFITACCADETTSTCGTAMQGGACATPSMGDARCPTITVMGAFMLPSCCATNGMCGLDASMFGMPGCIDLAAAAAQAMSMGGGSTDIPAPRSCDGDSDAGAHGDADAGM